MKYRGIYGFLNQYSNIDYVQSWAILTPLNVNIDSLNSEFVNDLPGEPIVSKSIDYVVDEYDITRCSDKLHPQSYLEMLWSKTGYFGFLGNKHILYIILLYLIER